MPSVDLNVQFLRGLKSSGKAVDYFDQKVTGFGVRVSPAGKRVFFYRYRTKSGRIRKVTIGPLSNVTLADARARARELAVSVQQGQDPQGEIEQKRAAETVAEVIELFIAHSNENNRPTTAFEDARCLRKDVIPVFGAWKLSEVRRKDVILLLERVKARKTRGKSGAPIAANRLQQVISRLFEFCVNRDLLEVNPIYRLKKLTKEIPRNRFLSDDEIKKFLEAIENTDDQLIGIALHLILLLARRKREVLGWRWCEIQDGIWTIPAERSKSKRPVTLPLPPTALTLIEKLKQYPFADLNGYMFPSPSKNNIYFADPKKAFKRITKDLQFENFTIHDLRRTAATRMRTLGINRDDIEAVLGHAQGRLIETYQCEHPIERTRNALQRWAEHLHSLRQPKSTNANNVIHVQFRNKSSGTSNWISNAREL